MKNSIILKTILLISGLIAAAIGGGILFFPADFYAAYNIDLGQNISLLNEMKASGGGLLATGFVIVAGVFVAKLTFTSSVLAALLYLSYGLSRILSMTIDGMPVEGLQQAAFLEIGIGLFCVFAFAKYREKEEA
ncbi:MAG: DUF4345 domain-containing protein [Alphaproteobacteria bacterium]|nr:DUF4345 domain-containing protein [Alphaproteobacteria bacterium]